MCLNYACTARWAHVPGSIHGPREPFFIGLLLLTVVLTLMPWLSARGPLGRWARLIAWAGILGLAVLFFVWFPFRTWSEIPFLDNWPARYQSTLRGVHLLTRGAFVGWQWDYLGGY